MPYFIVNFHAAFLLGIFIAPAGDRGLGTFSDAPGFVGRQREQIPDDMGDFGGHVNALDRF
jgi:hypothetical protein